MSKRVTDLEFTTQQEISDALAGQMSNQDEDEVEDELERMEMEREANTINLPAAPDGLQDKLAIDSLPDVPVSADFDSEPSSERVQRQKEKARARRVALHA